MTISLLDHQLFDERWAVEVWDNFMECLIENTK